MSKKKLYKLTALLTALMLAAAAASCGKSDEGTSITGTETGDAGQAGVQGEAGDETENHDLSAGSDASGSEESAQTGSEENAQSGTSSSEIPVVTEEADAPMMEVVEKAEASYEEWLAAGMIIGISMQYSDFSIEGIYLTGETEPGASLDSSGACVVFTSNGNRYTILSEPLEGERTAPGTIDLYTMDLGYASFDVSEADVDTSSWQEVTLEDLEELISQSILVTLYEH